MPRRPTRSQSTERAFAETCDRWAKLCAQYLPIVPEDSFWRLSRFHNISDPAQGWKLHVSATLLSANSMLEKVGPFLKNRGVLFKAPKALNEISKLNCGMHYGYTQVGKCLTVYPQTVQEGLVLANQLHELTAGLGAPVIPFDRRFKPHSCVYYRYGPFRRLQLPGADGSEKLAVRDPGGTLVADCRASDGAELSGTTDPFAHTSAATQSQTTVTPLKTTFRAFRALVQRGKGGVYEAIDLSGQEPRLCILKEGRRHGEVGWDGRDGAWRIRNERKVLRGLSRWDVGAPRIYGSFEIENNFYLVIEFIEGQSLDKVLSLRQRRLSISQVVNYATQLACVLSQLHAAGWVWRDCKPSNLIVSETRLRPIDFEGACKINQRHPLPVGTREFLPADFEEHFVLPAHPSADLYAMGVVIYYLLAGVLPSLAHPIPIQKLRKNVPNSILRVVTALMHPDPKARTPAHIVAEELSALSTQPS